MTLSEEAGPDAGSERRQGERHMAMLQVAKFSSEGREELCLIRNISEGGMQIQTYCVLEQEQRIIVSMRAGLDLAGRVAWVRDGKSGIQFEDKQPIRDILSGKTAIAGQSARSPRLTIDMPVEVALEGQTYEAQLCDISLGGIKIVLDVPCSPGATAQVTINGLGRRAVSVCWIEYGRMGLNFLPAIPYAEFAEWRLGMAPC